MIQKLFWLIGIGMLISCSVWAQQRQCGTMEKFRQDIVWQQEYQKQKAAFQKYVQKTASLKNPDCSNGPVILPVAIHYQGVDVSEANIGCLETLAANQIDILNEDYSATNTDISEWAAVADSFPNTVLGNPCIEFCLATYNHPTGTGIAEGDLAITYNEVTDTFFRADWAGYINLVVVKDYENLGLSFVAGDFSGTTTIINACAFGSDDVPSCLSDAGATTIGPGGGCFTDGIYNKGRTATHEVGHYLGLFHVFCDEVDNQPDCTCDDSVFEAPFNITDTPTSSEAHGGCPDLGPTTTSCGSQDLFMNFMDYVNDECMYMFTSDQSTVMNSWAQFNEFTTDLPVPCEQICPQRCLGVQITR